MKIDKITAINDDHQLVHVTISHGSDKYKYDMNTPVLEGDVLQAHCDEEEKLHLTNILYQVYGKNIKFNTVSEWDAWIDDGCKIAEVSEMRVTVQAVEAKDAVMGERQKTETVEVEEEVSNTEIVKEDGKYVQKTTTETITKQVEQGVTEEVDLYNESGEKIGKHTVPVMESYEVSPAVEAVDEVTEEVVVKAAETISKKTWVDTH